MTCGIDAPAHRYLGGLPFHRPMLTSRPSSICWPLLAIACNSTPMGDDAIPRTSNARSPRTVAFTVDRSGPEAVLATIQGAIAANALDSLTGLCDPWGQADRGCQTLCRIATDDMVHIEKFKGWFTHAILTGPVVHAGDTATLPVLLDPESQPRDLDLRVIKRGGEWYLLRFQFR